MNEIKIGVLLNYLNIIVYSLTALLYTPYMIKVLGMSEFGLFSIAISIISYLSLFEGGFSKALVRFGARFYLQKREEELARMYGLFLIIFLLIDVILLVCGGGVILLAENIFSSSLSLDEVARIKIIISILLLNLIFSLPMSIWGSILISREKFIFNKSILILKNILYPLVMIVLLSKGYKAITMVVVMAVFNVIALLANCFYCFFCMKVKLNVIGVRIKDFYPICKYSFWIFLIMVCDKFYLSSGQIILGTMVDTSAVSVYAVFITLGIMFDYMSLAISSVFFPRVTKLNLQEDASYKLSKMFTDIGKIQFFILSLIVSAFILLGHEFIVLWVGESFSEVYYFCIVYFIPSIVPLIQNIGVSILEARNRMKIRAVICLASSLFGLVLAILLVPYFGVWGCVIANTSVVCVSSIIAMNYVYFREKIDIKLFWMSMLRPVVFSFVITFILLFTKEKVEFQVLDWFDFMMDGLFYMLFYSLLYYFISLSKEERNKIKVVFS